MEFIKLPNSPKITEISKNTSKFEIKPCFPGYGVTLGNSLRRVLLSSLEGYAIKSVKIKGVEHEFSTLEGVLEDAIEMILNLKKIRFQAFVEEETTLKLSKKGEGRVTAKDFKVPSNVKIVNPDAYIATITNPQTTLEMEITIDKGIGYVPTEDREGEVREIGKINIDACFTPVKKVSYEVSNLRVGKRTDYNKLEMTIETDGSITPEEAYNQACQILIKHFEAVLSQKEVPQETKAKKEEEAPLAKEETAQIQMPDLEMLEKPVDQLEISTRTSNALLENKIKTVKALIRKTKEQLTELEGLGEKGVDEISEALSKHNLSLR
jgi:DNA-directed RNA polymerase subunit alpha